MIKVKSRKELDTLDSKPPAPAAAAKPAPRAPADSSMKDVHAAMTKLAGQVEQAVKVIADTNTQQATSKKMEAVIHRDANGRMERVTINVIK